MSNNDYILNLLNIKDSNINIFNNIEEKFNFIEENFDKIEHSDEEIMNLIKSSMDYANKIVYEKAKANEELEQMGTTLEICIIYNSKAYIGHIGDSRIYRIRKNIIRRITTDHSYVEKLVKDGTITREEAFYHPKKNMLIKALRM